VTVVDYVAIVHRCLGHCVWWHIREIEAAYMERDVMSTAKERIKFLTRYLEKIFRETFRLAGFRAAGKPDKTGATDGWRPFEQLLLCTCFGVTVVSGIVLLVLVSEMKRFSGELKDLRKDIASAQFRLGKLESDRLATKNTSETIYPGARQLRGSSQAVQPLKLTDADISTIRQFIKTIPLGRPLQTSARIGDAVSPSLTVPVPPALVDALPTLAGAGFSIDNSGAILIIGKDTGKIVARAQSAKAKAP
jgi:hypothetical protein